MPPIGSIYDVHKGLSRMQVIVVIFSLREGADPEVLAPDAKGLGLDWKEGL